MQKVEHINLNSNQIRMIIEREEESSANEVRINSNDGEIYVLNKEYYLDKLQSLLDDDKDSVMLVDNTKKMLRIIKAN